MMLQLKVIWHLFILCAIGFALLVRGSTGFSIFPSKEAASAFSHVEEQNLDYIPSVAPFLNGSAFLPPLTSHPFESSPPGPKNIQPSPSHLPSTAIVSPTQSAVGPQPPSSAPPSLGAPSHDLAPQQPIHVYATPPVAIPDIPTLLSPAVQPHNLTPSLPVFAPYASASPQASIPKHAYSPASTAVPSHVSSLPPVAISPHTSVPRPPVTPSHVSSLPPLAISPHTSVPRPPVTLSHISSLPPLAVTPHTSVPHTPVTPSHVSSLPPLAISPHTSVPQPPVMPSHVFASPPLVSRPSLSTPPPSTTFHDSTRPPPAISPSISSKSPRPSEYALPPSHTVGRTPSALSPQASSTTPTHATTIHHRTSPSPVAYPRSASSPPSVPLKATFPSTPVAPLGNLAPLPSIPTLPARPPSAPMTFHTSTPLPPVRSEGLAPYSPPIVPLLPLPVVLPSHLPTPSPSVAPHDPTPLLAPPTIPDSSAPPPVAVNPHHFGSSPTISPYATPKSRVPSHSSAPPPQLMPSDVTAPPLPSATPPITIPSHAMAPPPFDNPRVLASPPTYTPKVSAPPPNPNIPEHSSAQSPFSAPTHASSSPPTALSPPPASHDLGPPPTHAPYISAPPPGATVSDHSSAPPPTPPIDASSPPPHVVPPIVSPPSPPDAAPSHDLAPSPPAESHFSVPPPSSTPPISSPTSKNASYPPSASVPPHASAPSTAAESPLIASSPSVHTVPSGSLPPVSSPVASNSSAPLVVPPVRSPSINPVIPREPPSISPEAQLPHVSSPAPSIDQRGVPVPVAPSGQTHPLSPAAQHPLSPATQDPQGFAPYIAPSVHKSRGLPSLAPVASVTPPISPTVKEAHSPSFSPLPSISKGRHQTSYNVPSPAPNQQGQHESPAPESTPKYHPPTIHNPGTSPAMAPSQSPSTEDYISPASVSALPFPSGPSMTPFLSPEISPSGSSTKKPELAPPILALPPPPPNDNCLSYTCLEPYTNTIPGSPCGCVLPMKVELRIGVALYNFFPLVPEMAREIATGIFMKQSQVRIMGANAATEQPDKTLLLIDLVPLGDKLDNITAFLIYERFWNKQVAISKSLFGDYDVLNVQYPGLPPSPPMAPSDMADMNGGPYPGGQGSKIHPLGVDVSKQGRKHRLSGILIAIIVFSAVGAVLLCLLLGWILLFRHRRHVNQSADAPHVYPSSIARSTGPTGQSAGSRPSFSLSFESSVAAYTGSAKTFSAGEIEKATDNLNPSRVLGEGGFGRVYSGVLEDGTEVAVKVLKRDDQQGGREFLAEVEMLSRLHHRNLVKLIGICVEEHVRCLVYELVPNGSVDSHLHGTDRQTAPLDWATRLKIALGAARGLAYLHEDSSPRVIHRDFKASNILLESDFTPKVSDFGLARTAMDEENKHISTRVMGTFGYVAPEYAMTGHLLVKSDVYSYGVVLLELLTGRKPVDMSQPPGQENLVAWTRPYLTSKEALKSIIDSDLGPDISFDSVAKVAAIASMCVQPEVSHRPFMGEVVQALKLVCNECDDAKDEFDLSSQDENLSNEARDHPLQAKYSVRSYGEDVEKGLSVSDVFTTTDVGSGCKGSESYRRHSSSGPIGGGRSWRFWKRARTTSSREDVGGENGMYRFWSGSH